LFLAGALHLQVGGRSILDTSIQAFADGQELQIVAHAIRDGRLRQGTFGEDSQTVDIETEDLRTAEGDIERAQAETREETAVHSGIRLKIYTPRTKEKKSGESARLLHYGERIRFLAKLRPPRNFRNPGAFDYEGYLAGNGIAALGSAKAQNVEVLPGFAGTRTEYWRKRVHNNVIAKVHQLWPAPQAALIDAMVIGEEAFIDRDTRIDFQRSGTYHVLVVSGMNVSILAVVVFWTLRRLRLGDIPATLLTVAVCFAYAFLTEVGTHQCGAQP
jgi:competence protein ComEC